METLSDLVERLSQELKRGTLVYGVLLSLDEQAYGYALVQRLKANGMEIEGNTLYPLLRRLEKQGVLKSVWVTDDLKPKKYYTLTKLGFALREKLETEWQDTQSMIARLKRGGVTNER